MRAGAGTRSPECHPDHLAFLCRDEAHGAKGKERGVIRGGPPAPGICERVPDPAALARAANRSPAVLSARWADGWEGV